MEFDLCEHNIRQVIIKCGKLLYPGERDVTELYRKTCEAIGRKVEFIKSSDVNHMPSPEESARQDPNSKFTIICPQCGKRTFVLYSLCRSCKDAEGGIFKSMFKCYECHHEGKSKESIVVWMERLGIEFATQSKKSLGLKTITDGGIK